MKRFALFIFIILFIPTVAFEATAMNDTDQSTEQRLDNLFGEHQVYKAFFFQLKNAVLKNQRKQVSELIAYPITIYGNEQRFVIKSKAEFLMLYDAIFSPNMLAVIEKQAFKDLFAKSQGIMMGQGEVWFHGACADNACEKVSVAVKSLYNPSFFTSVQGKKVVSDFMNKEKSRLHPSLLTFIEPVLLWHTKNYIIRIDRLSANNYRYATWNIGSSQSKKPNIIITKGKLFHDGSGGNHHYEFKNGAYTYVCRVHLIGAEDTPPGSIVVFDKDKKVLYQPVLKVLSL